MICLSGEMTRRAVLPDMDWRRAVTSASSSLPVMNTSRTAQWRVGVSIYTEAYTEVLGQWDGTHRKSRGNARCGCTIGRKCKPRLWCNA